MRMKKTMMLLLLFLAGFLLQGTAQNVTLVVTTTNGTEQSFQLTNEGQLYFEEGERLVIEDGTGTTATFQLAEVRKLICTEIAGVGESDATSLRLLPNPARDHFLISNLQRSCEARIYALDGRLVKSFTASEGITVDISELSKGMYLLHIDGQTLKMMKL